MKTLKNHLQVKELVHPLKLKENGRLDTVIVNRIYRKQDILEVWEGDYDHELGYKTATIVLNNGNSRDEAEVIALVSSYDYVERYLR